MVEDRQCQTGENRDPTETRLWVPFTRIPPVEPCQHHTESCNMSEDGSCDQAQPGNPWSHRTLSLMTVEWSASLKHRPRVHGCGQTRCRPGVNRSVAVRAMSTGLTCVDAVAVGRDAKRPGSLR